MSPELRRKCDNGAMEINKFIIYELSDIFSLGLTILEAYGLRLEFVQGFNKDENLLKEKIKSIKGERLQQVLQKMLTFDPCSRGHHTNILMLI